MCRLIESIKINNQGIHNLKWHEKRMNESRKALFDIAMPIALEPLVQLPKIESSQTIKCRVIYSEEVNKVEYLTYTKNKISHLKIVHADNISYNFKYENRSMLQELLEYKGDCDDVLIVKNGRITDTSYCNIVFFNGEKWITPKFPLLKGTMRDYLLEIDKIQEEDIFVEDVYNYQKFKLINAMFGFENEEYAIENLVM